MPAAPPILGSTGSTMLVLATILVLVGIAMVCTSVWLVRATRSDARSLGPLEVMGARSFRRRDDAARAAALERARPQGAPPPAPMVEPDDEPTAADAESDDEPDDEPTTADAESDDEPDDEPTTADAESVTDVAPTADAQPQDQPDPVAAAVATTDGVPAPTVEAAVAPDGPGTAEPSTPAPAGEDAEVPDASPDGVATVPDAPAAIDDEAPTEPSEPGSESSSESSEEPQPAERP